jgi:hypothetical protein
VFNEQELHSMELLIDEAIGMQSERWRGILSRSRDFVDDALQILIAASMTTSKMLLIVSLGDVCKGDEEKRKKLNDDADAHARRNIARLIESLNAPFGFKTDSLKFAQIHEDEEGVPYWFAPSALEAWPGQSGGQRLEMIKGVTREIVVRLNELRRSKTGEQKKVCELAHVFSSVSASKMLLLMASPAYGDAVERMANRATHELLKAVAAIGGYA